MADAVLFIGQKCAVPGREQQAMDLFQKVMEYYAKSQSEGKIESSEPVLLRSHGGDLNGFILIKGDTEKLSKFAQEDTFNEHCIEAAYCLDGFGVIPGAFGEKLSRNFSIWSKQFGK